MVNILYDIIRSSAHFHTPNASKTSYKVTIRLLLVLLWCEQYGYMIDGKLDECYKYISYILHWLDI